MKFKFFILISLISFLSVSKCLSMNNLRQDPIVNLNNTNSPNYTGNTLNGPTTQPNQTISNETPSLPQNSTNQTIKSTPENPFPLTTVDSNSSNQTNNNTTNTSLSYQSQSDQTVNNTNTNPSNSTQTINTPSQNQEINNQDSQQETILELPVTYSTGITYYYPYFYKTHLIAFPEDSNNFFSQVQNPPMTTCEKNCFLCSAEDTTKCMKCSSGFYLDQSKCVEYCPEGKLADNLRASCVAKESSANIDVVYSMAYSVGSCNNMCGKMVQDCSCSPSCKSKGNCCTNYDVVNCDFVIEKNSKIDEKKCKDAGCELCEEKDNSLKCVQCPGDKYLMDGSCVNACPEGFSANNVNRICKKQDSICKSIPNCENCSVNDSSSNGSTCRKCSRGTFLYNSSCVDKCPEGYRADRVTWTCLEPPVFGWYWVYPSRNSCQDKCNIQINDNKDSNCSCLKECVQEGSCCPDYDFYCENVYYMRKNKVKDSDKTKKKLLGNQKNIKLNAKK